MQSQHQLQKQGYITGSFIEIWERSKKIEKVDGKVTIFSLNFKAMPRFGVEEGWKLRGLELYLALKLEPELFPKSQFGHQKR